MNVSKKHFETFFLLKSKFSKTVGEEYMKTISYYISEYGFGHASRSIAIIRELLKRSENIKIIVCNSFALNFLKESLVHPRVTFRDLRTDIGYFINKSNLELDVNILNIELKKYLSDFAKLVRDEKTFLIENNVDLTISDISPLPFVASKEVGISSIGISNFTWYTAYKNQLSNSGELDIYKHAYYSMDKFFSLFGSEEPLWTQDTKIFNFFSRRTSIGDIERIRETLNVKNSKKLIFLGLGMKMQEIDLNQLPIWNSPDCIFLVSSNVCVSKENVYNIPNDYTETQNYIAACDLVISKPGWGIVSEAIMSRTPLLLVDRRTMEEDSNTIMWLKRENLCQTLTWEELRNLRLNSNSVDCYKSNMNYIIKSNEENLLEIVNEILSSL